ncbi:hypothetical protein C7974DRAFT_471779 [Boeremia exigua]|uniref:uncharacterized protein n=1 Tax=Boeremia exigua TaxID=749465 RepID=UPI001E8CC072|nr:uncharacterized protein C7974DRAFT_471779 [Boeremia exigua]KAH6633700.1 hypothetical protein C7974DRAFT_471779 [Boeremia exigua]
MEGPSSVAGPMRCARCDCSFRRLEHLRRHERIHDGTKRFVCTQCLKVFTRSDILHRHEATHAAATQARSARAVSTRACTECARSKERCTKSSPCQRCSAKGLDCVYPHARVGRDQNTEIRSRISLESPNCTPIDLSGITRTNSTLQSQTQAFAGPEPTNTHSVYTSYQQMLPFEVAEYPQSQMLQTATEFPINWLPPDPALAIDYDNIVGVGIGTDDVFTFPSPPDDSSNQNNVHQESVQLLSSQLQLNTVQRDANLIFADEFRTIWSTFSPDTAGGYMSSESPHTISPSDAPGGLYATSINGARMPCTIRARRTQRLMPGAKPIRRLHQLHHDSLYENGGGMAFPDISHITVDDTVDPASGSIFVAPTLSGSIYEDVLQNFNILCLDNSSSFPSYTSSRFPDIRSLNMCIRLYFENFDTIVPILHNQVTQISDHWALALAVSAIGCQYAEADEYVQMAEPMHEFLRRATAVTINAESMATGRSRHHIAFIQAMTLSQFGMLYSGSPKLLNLARANHSAMTQLARALICPRAVNDPASTATDGADRGSPDRAWRDMLLDECKRRIGYAIWLLDCMGVYHFGQQILMSPDMMSVALPNDRLWRSKSASELLVPRSLRETPSLSSAIASLFREKRVMTELGQFGRVILLHGVYREIFLLKDCLARPLGSLQQPTTAGDDETPTSPSIPDSNGRCLLNSWRNAALDCIDVLHWAANGTIALQAGAEHPTVLHLHLSRTILLAPIDRFQTLASSVASLTQRAPSLPSRRQTAAAAEHDILEWAQRDQCKARLAVLHAGCLFWHIRRYSTRAFYEPHAVFLATLTLWAYSSYAARSPHRARDERVPAARSRSRPFNDTDDADEADDPPSFIHLDRPNDDEMVQIFVRSGTAAAMRANVAGVGDIYSTKGPARILREGMKILGAVSVAWGRTERYMAVLEGLEKAVVGCGG